MRITAELVYDILCSHRQPHLLNCLEVYIRKKKGGKKNGRSG